MAYTVSQFNFVEQIGNFVPAGSVNLTITPNLGQTIFADEFYIGGATETPVNSGIWVAGNVTTGIEKVIFTDIGNGNVNAEVFHLDINVDANTTNLHIDIDRDAREEIVDIVGCTIPNALNYNPNATVSNNDSCIFDDSPPEPIYGCTDEEALNYNAEATVDDGSCVLPVSGCTNPLATNYDPLANIDDGSCRFEDEEEEEEEEESLDKLGPIGRTYIYHFNSANTFMNPDEQEEHFNSALWAVENNAVDYLPDVTPEQSKFFVEYLVGGPTEPLPAFNSGGDYVESGLDYIQDLQPVISNTPETSIPQAAGTHYRNSGLADVFPHYFDNQSARFREEFLSQHADATQPFGAGSPRVYHDKDAITRLSLDNHPLYDRAYGTFNSLTNPGWPAFTYDQYHWVQTIVYQAQDGYYFNLYEDYLDDYDFVVGDATWEIEWVPLIEVIHPVTLQPFPIRLMAKVMYKDRSLDLGFDLGSQQFYDELEPTTLPTLASETNDTGIEDPPVNILRIGNQVGRDAPSANGITNCLGGGPIIGLNVEAEALPSTLLAVDPTTSEISNVYDVLINTAGFAGYASSRVPSDRSADISGGNRPGKFLNVCVKADATAKYMLTIETDDKRYYNIDAYDIERYGPDEDSKTYVSPRSEARGSIDIETWTRTKPTKICIGPKRLSIPNLTSDDNITYTVKVEPIEEELENGLVHKTMLAKDLSDLEIKQLSDNTFSLEFLNTNTSLTVTSKISSNLTLVANSKSKTSADGDYIYNNFIKFDGSTSLSGGPTKTAYTNTLYPMQYTNDDKVNLFEIYEVINGEDVLLDRDEALDKYEMIGVLSIQTSGGTTSSFSGNVQIGCSKEHDVKIKINLDAIITTS